MGACAYTLFCCYVTVLHGTQHTTYETWLRADKTLTIGKAKIFNSPLARFNAFSGLCIYLAIIIRFYLLLFTWNYQFSEHKLIKNLGKVLIFGAHTFHLIFSQIKNGRLIMRMTNKKPRWESVKWNKYFYTSSQPYLWLLSIRLDSI